MDVGDKFRQFQRYVKDLEEELYKIMVFKRESPLSIQLVSHQIQSCRMFIGDENPPPLITEEFISLKSTFSSEKESQQTSKDKSSNRMGLPIKPKKLEVAKPIAELEEVFHSYEKQKLVFTPPSPAAEPPKKRRRYWSSDLHQRFIDALQQLGGSDVATPKQIRELMQIDNLTTDEVKTHLQKYRLHTKRPPPAIQSSSSQAPQFLVVGKIWFPSAVQQSNEESGAPLSGIYAPNASKPSLNGPLNYDGRRCGQDSSSSLANDGATNSSSHTSSQTITT